MLLVTTVCISEKCTILFVCMCVFFVFFVFCFFLTSSAVEARNRGGILIDFLWSHDGGFESATQMGAARRGTGVDRQ